MVQDTPDPDDDEEAWVTASRRADVLRRLLESDTGRLQGKAVAAMAAFFADVRQAFARITNAASAAMGATIDRWLGRLPPCNRELLTGCG